MKELSGYAECAADLGTGRRYIMINTASALNALVERALSEHQVAIDTEFLWERTYNPVLGLVQVGFDHDECFLVDTLAVEDLTPLGRVISSPKTVKIFHDAQQDLTILRRATGAYPRNVFDTRCAAGFAGLASTISLRDLLRDVLGVSLSKSESRTNWLRRPLTEAQIAYAVDDVRYMVKAYRALRRQARDLGLHRWLQSELKKYDDPSLYEDKEPREQFRRIRGAAFLAPEKLPVLMELAAWREEEAIRRDCPRGHVLTDAILMRVAETTPRSEAGLDNAAKNSNGGVGSNAKVILNLVNRGLSLAESDRPSINKPIREKDELKIKVTNARKAIVKKCTELGVDPGLVATRAEVAALIVAGKDAKHEDHRLLNGWRRTFLSCILPDSNRV